MTPLPAGFEPFTLEFTDQRCATVSYVVEALRLRGTEWCVSPHVRSDGSVSREEYVVSHIGGLTLSELWLPRGAAVDACQRIARYCPVWRGLSEAGRAGLAPSLRAIMAEAEARPLPPPSRRVDAMPGLTRAAEIGR